MSPPSSGSLSSQSHSFVLQRYISSPFLFDGRKFDIRSWAMLDVDYHVYLYRHSVCRTSCAPFQMNDLEDTFAHLTNHCIQERHPDYAKKEEGNEVFLPQLQQYLDSLSPTPSLPHRLCVICHLLPQIRHVIRETLLSVKDSLRSTGEWHAFHLFGYDFILDSNFRIQLLEVNATPAAAKKVLKRMVKDLIHTAVDTVYIPPVAQPSPIANPTAGTAVLDPTTLLSTPNPTFSVDTLLSQPCHCAQWRGKLSKSDYLDPTDESINLFDRIA